jgi:Trk-type K+ transport system membrane component
MEMALILGKFMICGERVEELTNDRWLGIFNGVSAFNNSGMSLLDANMVGFYLLPIRLNL